MKIEKSEMISQERNPERNFSIGGPSLSKRTRESQVESVHSSTTKGRRQGPTMTPGFSRGISTRQGERLECPHCQKYNSGTCKWITWGCFRCGSINHLIVNCLQGFGIPINPQGSNIGG